MLPAASPPGGAGRSVTARDKISRKTTNTAPKRTNEGIFRTRMKFTLTLTQFQRGSEEKMILKIIRNADLSRREAEADPDLSLFLPFPFVLDLNMQRAIFSLLFYLCRRLVIFFLGRLYTKIWANMYSGNVTPKQLLGLLGFFTIFLNHYVGTHL